MKTKTKTKSIYYVSILFVVWLLIAGHGSVWCSPYKEMPTYTAETRIGVVYPGLMNVYPYANLQSECLFHNFETYSREFAKDHDVALIKKIINQTVDTTLWTVKQLVDENVDAIILCLQRPADADMAVAYAHERGVPVVIVNFGPGFTIDAPCISTDVYYTGLKLGIETANVFNNAFPGEEPKLLIVDSGIELGDPELETGFINGFKTVLNNLNTDRITVYDESQICVSDILYRSFIEECDFNIFFGTSDIHTYDILYALKRIGRGTVETELIVGCGGLEKAMQELSNPTSAWKIEAGINIAEYVEMAYQLINAMLCGRMPLTSNSIYFVETQYLINPTDQQIQAYLESQKNQT